MPYSLNDLVVDIKEILVKDQIQNGHFEFGL